MTTERRQAIAELQVRELIEDWAKAVRAKDINAMMSNYASDVVSFDAVTQLQIIGSDAVRRRAEEWVSGFQSTIGYEVRDLSITAGDTVAFSHCLSRVSGTVTDGKNVDMWVRATICFHKFDSKWMVTHEHISVPFDMKSGSVLLDLKP